MVDWVGIQGIVEISAKRVNQDVRKEEEGRESCQ